MPSEPWRTPKVRRPRRVVQHFVDYISTELEGANSGLEFYVGGSWRRGAETIGDLDVVIVTESGEFNGDLFGSPGVQLPRGVDFQRQGPKIAQGGLELEIPKDGDSELFFEHVAMHVDFWCCKPSEVGAFLAFVTGPKELNVAMRTAAIKRGLSLSQNGLFVREVDTIKDGKPVYRQGAQVDDGTERDVFAKLGWSWMEPEERESWAKPKSDSRVVKVPSSDGKRTYDVTIDSAGRAVCSCPAYKYRGNCKHQAMAATMEAGK